ncbi:hypothetical protein STRIP9103_09739, partial [Streptomyces ipomoeae 91-03]
EQRRQGVRRHPAPLGGDPLHQGILRVAGCSQPAYPWKPLPALRPSMPASTRRRRSGGGA